MASQNDSTDRESHNDTQPPTPDMELTPQKRSLFGLLFDQVRIDEAVQAYPYQGEGTSEKPFIVTWIPDDAGDPMQWSFIRRWIITIVSAITCFAVAFSSSAYTGTMKGLIIHFDASTTLITAGLSLYVLGFAIGPLLWAPLSEIYGRQVVFTISYGLYVVFSFACIADDGLATLLVLRFFSGACGAATLTNAASVISDVFPADQRSTAMGVFSLAPAMGPTLGPFIGGYLGESEGWRPVMGLMGVLAAVCYIMGLCLVPETYAPILLKKRAQALSNKTNRVYKATYELQSKTQSATAVLKEGFIRPWQLMFAEPIVLVLSIYTSIVYGTLYLLFSAYPVVFQLERGWSAGKGGLAFLGIAVGMVLALPVVVCINRWYEKIRKASPGGVAPPEARLLGGMIGGVTLPIGMFWFAWTTYTDIHWAAPISSGIFFGLGLTLVFHSIFNYLIDAYVMYSASALAANTVLRSLFGAGFPLFTTDMYEELGTQWASSVPAFLALACLPMPFILYKYGAAIRKRSKYAPKEMTETKGDTGSQSA